jgi:hypothetical protein
MTVYFSYSNKRPDPHKSNSFESELSIFKTLKIPPYFQIGSHVQGMHSMFASDFLYFSIYAEQDTAI